MNKIPREKGVYVLCLKLDKPFKGIIGSLGLIEIPSGYYVYVGSAQGAGGLQARISRHLRKSKKKFWHIDYLLEKAKIVKIYYAITPSKKFEYLLARKMISKGFKVLVEGFGSSEYKFKNYSHLLYLGQNINSEPILSSFKELGLNVHILYTR